MKPRIFLVVFVAAILSASATGSSQSLQSGRHMSGQGVQPTFEGWEYRADGSIEMVFGYLNRNYEEQVDIPIGPDNSFDVAGDRGQPTHFYPRRNQFVFRVPVPKDWDPKRRLVWTLTAHGQTNYAKGVLLPEFQLNHDVLVENSGGIPDYENQAPAVTGQTDLAVTLPQALALNVSVTDDGRPQRTGRSRGRSGGLTITWQQYRGPGSISFEPGTTSLGTPPADTTVSTTTNASFAVAGDYVIRAKVSDGNLTTPYDIRVTVAAAQTPSVPGANAVQGRVLWNEQPAAGARVVATSLYDFSSTHYGEAITSRPSRPRTAMLCA
jgi:hypothetical protein